MKDEREYQHEYFQKNKKKIYEQRKKHSEANGNLPNKKMELSSVVHCLSKSIVNHDGILEPTYYPSWIKGLSSLCRWKWQQENILPRMIYGARYSLSQVKLIRFMLDLNATDKLLLSTLQSTFHKFWKKTFNSQEVMIYVREEIGDYGKGVRETRS